MSDSPAEKAEAAAIRRRWVTLGEIVAIAGLVISALALWSSWSERRADDAQRRVEKTVEARARTAVTLTATVAGGGGALVLADSAHPVQGIVVRFPSALGIAPKSSNVRPRIEARWFAGQLLKLTDKGADEREGRLPVIIAADYWDGDRHITDTARYDIVWRTQGRLLQGRALRLEGLVLHARDGSPAKLDAAWAAIKPAG
ncbi:MAG: hypothetical protein K2P79_10365 [Sphingomonas sp.]|nr:hypothetical protein [Sphingomonas sp.]